MKVRYESFGGIIALDKPPALVFVNKPYMRKLGYKDSALWKTSSTRLHAPTEIHFSVTNRCNQHCRHCYTRSVSDPSGELTTQHIMGSIDAMADAGVFHVALGGGESLMREDIFEIARYIREKDMVPNLTTNGLLVDREMARQCRVFGQINVSMDGMEEDNRQPRGTDISASINAIRILKKEKNRTGINLVVNRYNYTQISEVMRFARKERLADVELLRLKPTGRAEDNYRELCCTPEQHRQFFPQIMEYAKKFKLDVKIDCSYIPMVCYHKPDKNVMEKFHIRGCDAGNILAAVDSTGNLKACSFAGGTAGNMADFRKAWNTSEHFRKYTGWKDKAPQPCRSCEYLVLCMGGCHVVAEFLTGSMHNPDPECPCV